MSPSQSLSVRLAPAALLLLVSGPRTDLQVLRVTPGEEAAASATVTITFDRPVAGSLDRTVDPGAIFRIEPRVAGRVDWRDPVTLRFRPDTPLSPNTVYSITVSDRFEAMDGSRLPAPYVHRFRVRGPRILAAQPVNAGMRQPYVTPDSRFELVLDGRGEARVRWFVDGVPYPRPRWPLRSGVHRFRAVSALGDSAEVSVTVE